MRILKDYMNKFISDERGHTVFALVWLSAIIGVTGLALDSSNAWRVKAELRTMADIGAHAAAVKVAVPGTDSDGNAITGADIYTNARQFAKTVVELNLANHKEYDEKTPFDNVETDIKFFKWSVANNQIDANGDATAVAVLVHRDEKVDNALPTLFMGLFGLPQWDISQYGIAIVGQSGECNLAKGFYADGQIHLSGDNEFTGEQCVHSQTQVWMPQRNIFNTDLIVSMPSLSDCGNKCVESANTGIEAAKRQVNMILPDYKAYIAEVEASMKTDTASTIGSHKKTFFDTTILDTDFSPLAAVGVSTGTLVKGSTVTLTQAEFEGLSAVPTGLVYIVENCSNNGNGSTLTIGKAAQGNKPATVNDIVDSVLISNCEIIFEDNAFVQGSMIIANNTNMTRTVDASSGATAGNTGETCNQTDQVFILSEGEFHSAAKFASNNLTFISDADFHFASGASVESDHKGLNIFTNGEIHMTTQHNMAICNYDTIGINLPEIVVIRHAHSASNPYTIN